MEQLNVGKNMTAEQIERANPLIYKKCFSWTAEDLKLCFNNALQGKYGRIFDRMDINALFEIINAYGEERRLILEQAFETRHDEVKQLESGPRKGWTPEMIAGLKGTIAQIQEMERKEKPFARNIIQSEERIRHNKWFALFDRLYQKWPVNGGKFIRRYGRVMNQTEFIQFKEEQLKKVMKTVLIIIFLLAVTGNGSTDKQYLVDSISASSKLTKADA